MLKREEEVLFDAVRAAQKILRIDAIGSLVNAETALILLRLQLLDPAILHITARIGERHD